MKKTILLLLLCGSASAVVVRPDGYDHSPRVTGITETTGPQGRPVKVVQLPSKIVTVTLPGKEVTKYVTLAEKKIVPAGEFAALKKSWDDEQEAQTLALALRIADQLDLLAVSGDDQVTIIGNQKKEAVAVAIKNAKENPCVFTRKALVGAIERHISK